MHDQVIEDRLRSTLRNEADPLPLTVTADELERRLALRRRERSNRRMGLLAAGIGAVAVGTVFALAVGPFRGPKVAATSEPSVTPTVEPSAPPNAGPAKLPTLDPSPSAVDFHRAGQFARPGTDATPEITHIDGVRMDAREAGIKFVCAGPDVAEITWGFPFETQADYAAIAKETVMCDSVVRQFRYEIAARQPLVGDLMTVVTSRRVSFSILVESFGSTNEPRPTDLPALAVPRGALLLDTRVDAGTAPIGTPATGRAGTVPPRHMYRVALVCLGTGSARWSIGPYSGRGFVDSGMATCDGAPTGVESSAGLPSEESTVYVTTDPGNSWHLVVTDAFGPPPFTPPALDMFAGPELKGRSASAPALCVGWDDHVDQCGLMLFARDGAHVVEVPENGAVSLLVGGDWRITQANVKVADRVAVREKGMQADIRDFAVLGDQPGVLTGSGDRMVLSVAGLAQGEWVVIVGVSAEKDGHTFGAIYELPLRVGG